MKNVKSKTIDEILQISNLYTNIDFLNIDIEGMDFKTLIQLVRKKLSPILISIETHDPANTKLRDCDQIISFLKENNYIIYKRVGPSTLFNINK